jgi:phage terminase Nu1 subunit (DNA packaging protein)
MKVNRAEFAELVGCSPPHVAALIREGMPATGGGKRGAPVAIETAEALPWMLDRARRRAEDEHSGPRAALQREQADKAEMQNEARRAELVPTVAVRSMATALVDAFDRAVADAPIRAAERIAATSDPAEVRAILQELVRDVRNDFADRIGTMAAQAAAG